jgi:hypothetical protein
MSETRTHRLYDMDDQLIFSRAAGEALGTRLERISKSTGYRYTQEAQEARVLAGEEEV